jgi:hypothetical protein
MLRIVIIKTLKQESFMKNKGMHQQKRSKSHDKRPVNMTKDNQAAQTPTPGTNAKNQYR